MGNHWPLVAHQAIFFKLGGVVGLADVFGGAIIKDTSKGGVALNRKSK